MSNLFTMNENIKIKNIKIEEKQETKTENNDEYFNKEEIEGYINELLTFEELTILANNQTQYKTDKIKIYKKLINNNIVIFRDVLYLYCDKLNIYLKSKLEPQDFLISYLLILKEKSHKKLSEKRKGIVPLSRISVYENKKDIQLLINYMSKEDHYFDDPKLNQIHFLNGYINFEDGKMYRRTKEDKMTYCIMKNFSVPKMISLKKMRNIINQIYPISEDRDNVMSM